MKLLTLILLTASAVAGASSCNEFSHATAPASRFDVSSDGTVTDLSSGLTWQRCAVGFAFDDGGTPDLPVDDRCQATGVPDRVDWATALGEARDLNASGGFAGFSDWRLPSVKELYSIVEFQCIRPAINSTVFPSTTPVPFWSGSAGNLIGSAYVVDFYLGQAALAFASAPETLHAVRLVRGGG
ncbi:MAG: DUF1566 domain-containing protein [Pseudomonadota bacterium]